MKYVFFLLLSLNLVIFVWEFFGAGAGYTGPLSDRALRRSEDPSIDRIRLVGERPEHRDGRSNGQGDIGPEGFIRPLSHEGSGIFHSANQNLFRSVERHTTRLIEDLLEAEMKRQINRSPVTLLKDVRSPSDPTRSMNAVEDCCPGFHPWARFQSFDPTLISSAKDSKGRSAPAVPAGTVGNTGSDIKDNPKQGTVQVPQTLAAPRDLCYKLGPRTSQAAFAQLTTDIRRMGGRASFKGENVDVETGYLVYYPAGESYEASKANLKTLYDRGLKDLWMINDGALRGSISLGFFRSRERAEILRKELEAKQLEARVQPRLSKRTAYFLFFRWPAATGELAARLLESGFDAKELVAIDSQVCGP